MPSEQLERVIDEADALPPVEDTESKPLMPFETSYKLTREQEEELVDHAMRRYREISDEMGLTSTGGGAWWLSGDGAEYKDPVNQVRTERTFMGKRILYDHIYENDVEHRAYVLGGVFAESNLVVPLARRIVRQMVARATNYFFATDPWFAAYPVGNNDKLKSDQVDRYTKWKMRKAKLQQEESMAVERSFVLGECVVKTTWARREQIYRTFANVLVDETGQAILGEDGDFILDSDTAIPAPSAIDPDTNLPIPSTAMVLKRDGATPIPIKPKYARQLITRRIVHYNGPEAKRVNFLDFLCPLDAETIQDADCVVHLYDQPVMNLADRWKKDQLDGKADASAEATRKAIDLIRDLANTGGEKRADENQANRDPDKERSMNTDPVAQIGEFYLRYDADGDGMMEEVMIVIDLKSRTPIFYDFTANVTPDGLRPFSVVRPNEKPGKWYGIGGMEMFETTQQFVDLTANRWNFAQSGAGRVDFWKPQNTLEGSVNPHLKLNWGGTYTPKGNYKAADCLESIYLESSKDVNLQQMIEFFMQLATNESGVSNANDARAAGLDTGELATGIRNIEKSGQEMFSLYLGHLEPGITDVLQRMVRLMMGNLDDAEVHTYFEDGENGEPEQGGMVQVGPSDIMDLDIDVEILLSRYRGEQVLESNAQGLQVVKDFYSQPYPIQVVTAELYREMLRNLQIKDADARIVPTQLPIMPGSGGPATPTVTAHPRQGNPNL